MIQETYITDKQIPLLQPKERSFRINMDTLLLMSALPKKQYMCELGGGVGSISILYALKEKQAVLDCIEPSSRYAYLAEENVKKNHLQDRITIIHHGISYLETSHTNYDGIFFNPPYESSQSFDPSPFYLKNIASCLSDPFEHWLEIALKRIRSKGVLTFIHKTQYMDRIVNFLFSKRLHIMIWPIYTKHNKPSTRFVLWCTRKQQRKFQLLRPLILNHHGNVTTEAHDIFYTGYVPEDIRQSIQSLSP